MSNLPKATGPVAKAIAETNEMIAEARAATKHRKLWGYVRNDALLNWAKTHKEQGVRDLAAVVDVVGIVLAEPRRGADTAPKPPSISKDGYELIDAPSSYSPGNLVPNESMAELARIFFSRPENAVVEVSHDTSVDKYIFAVWMGEEAAAPTTEPKF